MLDFLKSEIERTYNVLLVDYADMQNDVDIAAWRIDGLITDEEEAELRALNRELYRQYI